MNVLQKIVEILPVEESVMLATILSTRGSTPASALSKMIVTKSGASFGTVGGGCMEGDLKQAALKLIGSRTASIETVQLNENDIEFGLICGGTIDVLIEPVHSRDLPLYSMLCELQENGVDAILATFLGNDKSIQGKWIFRNDETTSALNATVTPEFFLTRFSESGNALDDAFQKATHRAQVIRLPVENGELILEPVQGNPSLIIFGGGHVSKYISQAAAMTGFRVTVVDDRKEFADHRRFPEAAATVVSDFRDIVAHLSITPSTYLVIVTRGHQYDEDVLEKALSTPAKYIGMIGSKRKVKITFDRLIAHGVKKESLDRVHAPMGIDIGSVTAEEIALSIVAELVHARRAEGKPLRHKYQTMKE